MSGLYILTSALGGALYGAIGASVAQASTSTPILKGALVGGAVSGTIATAIYVGRAAAGNQKTGTTSGLGGCRCGPNLLTGHRSFP